MGFWFFMFAMVAIIPLTMIIIGVIFYNRAPKNINFIFGYRTDLSMKNEKTWKFAHHLLGKIWMITGSILLPIMCIPIFCNKSQCGYYWNFRRYFSLNFYLSFSAFYRPCRKSA